MDKPADPATPFREVYQFLLAVLQKHGRKDRTRAEYLAQPALEALEVVQGPLGVVHTPQCLGRIRGCRLRQAVGTGTASRHLGSLRRPVP
jgi:hypothetical protein